MNRLLRRVLVLLVTVGTVVPLLGAPANAAAGHDRLMHSRGAADFVGSPGASADGTLVGVAGMPDGSGYWLAGGDGRVLHYGTARWYGSLRDEKLSAPVVGIVATPTGLGYWLFTRNGRVFDFGDARLRGSAYGETDAPITAMATTPTGDGYWLLNANGRVYHYGDARWRGAIRDVPHSGFAFGIAATTSGDGYWIATTSGGVFSFGDATFHGSLGSNPPASPIIAIARTPSGDGYWLAGNDGAVYAFGGATDRGGTYAMSSERQAIAFGATTSGAEGYWFVTEPKPVNYLLLGPGAQGKRVEQLQRRLLSLGYWVTVDGAFGPLTQQALYTFQKYERLSRTGSVNLATNSRLLTARRPVARTTSGSMIEVDIGRQIIMIVRNGTVKWVFSTSTGTETPYTYGGSTYIAHTSRGRFSIQRHIDGMRVSHLGQLWRPKYWDGGIAFHGSRSIPPYPASHGCSRLSYPAMDFVWSSNLMPIGASVWSY